ncbi:MAG: CAP domain-containing protein [Paracoccaceae bacterium]
MSLAARLGRLGAVVLLGLALPAAAAEVPDDLAALRERALALVNEDRAAHGLPTLEPRAALDEAAQVHAEDMAAQGYFAHEAPDGDDVRDRYLAAGGGRWKVARENIARCTNCAPDRERIEAFQEGWMDSPGHRANLLAGGLAGFGFGIAASGDRVWAVQTFAGPGASSDEGGPIAADAVARRLIERVNAARAEAGAAPVERSAALRSAAAALARRAFAEDGSLDLVAALPDGARSRFAALAASSVACGGCGTEPTAADVERLGGRLLEASGGRLTEPRFDRLGVALLADGTGRKTLAAVLGASR